jgi:predicted RNase H-like HicB family nuclease
VDVVLTYDARSKWWIAEAPFLPGAYGQGRTRAEARRSLVSAIRDLLDTYERLGQEPPIIRRVTIERTPLVA